MSRQFTLGLLLIVCGITANARTPDNPAGDFTMDGTESRIELSVGSSSGDIIGTFRSWKGNLYLPSQRVPQGVMLNLEILAATMTTGNGKKDKMIKGKKYLGVRDFPTISLNSRKVSTSGDSNTLLVEGDFTLRGVTKPFILPVILDSDNKGGGQIHADLFFDRRDFGITTNVLSMGARESVKIRLDLYLAPNSVSATPVYSWTKIIRVKASN